MSLVNCPECGRKKVSDSAESCPECGFGIRSYYEELELERIRQEAEKQAEEQRKKDKIEKERQKKEWSR